MSDREEVVYIDNYININDNSILLASDGELNLINDAEIPSIIYNTIKELGFEDFTICMNNRKLLTGRRTAL